MFPLSLTTPKDTNNIWHIQIKVINIYITIANNINPNVVTMILILKNIFLSGKFHEYSIAYINQENAQHTNNIITPIIITKDTQNNPYSQLISYSF